jgi:hypothetical protein
LRRDPLWRGCALYTLVTGMLYVGLFFILEQAVFYVWLAVILVWIEVMAIRLRSIVRDASPRQSARVS